MTDLPIAVSRASDDPVIDAGARIGSQRKVWPFLPSSSQILEYKALPYIESQYNVPSPPDVDELANFLALAASCHVLDGWRYLSQAALSILNGGSNMALHLAYYAELRAALSVLAASGIGILRTKHFVLTASRTVEWFRGRTHDAAWDALQEWSNSTPNARSLVESIGVFGFRGNQWAEACAVTVNADAIAENWLRNWSIDLKVDSAVRNVASYEPDLRRQGLKPLGFKEIEFVRSVSQACRFAGGGQLESTDVALIHDLCKSACALRFTSMSVSDFQRLWADVFHWFTVYQGTNKKDAVSMIRAIKGAPSTPAGRILSLADTTNTAFTGVFSRAFLLLRLASALKRRQWQGMQRRAPGGSCDWQQLLMADYGLHSQVWGFTTRPSSYDLLDEDRVVAEEDLDMYLKRNSRIDAHSLWTNRANALMQLCCFERVGILVAAS